MDIVIIGGRGNGTVVASTIEDCGDHCIGFLNDDDKDFLDGYPILGRPEIWKDFRSSIKFIYTLSSVKRASERYARLMSLKIPNDRFATVVHPTAVVSRQASLGAGVVIMPLAHVGPGVIIRDHSLLLAQSFVGHDTTLDDMVFVANNATVGGDVSVWLGVHIGSNSSILEHLNLGVYSVVGLGAVVVKDVFPYQVVVGNPAKVIKTLT